MGATLEVRKPSRQGAIAVRQVRDGDGMNQVGAVGSVSLHPHRWNPLLGQEILEISSLQLAITGLEFR